MPLYEFDCQQCGEPFEELVFSAARAAEVRCPTCGSPRVKKKLSTVASRVAGKSTGVSSSSSCSTGL